MPRFLIALLVALPLVAQAQTVQHPFTFTLVPSGLPSFRNVIAAWADYDNDGDLDAFVTGNARISIEGDYELQAHLYRNDGAVAAPDVPGGERPLLTSQPAGLVPMIFGDAAWGDYDGDGDLDLVVIGTTAATLPYAPRTILYRNDAGTLTPVNTPLADLHSGTATWADHDGDGDLDLLLTGTAASQAPYTPETHLYLNTDGTFAETPTNLPGLVFGALVWRDFAGDGRPDVYLSGLSAAGLVTIRYENRAGTYTEIAQETGTLFGRAEVATRASGAPLFGLTAARPSRFYLAGVTRLSEPAALPDLYGGGIDFGDLDGDGDLDVAVTGQSLQSARGEHHVFQQIGNQFVQKNLLLGTYGGPLRFLDYDGDGDLDLFAAGDVTTLYRNDRPRPAAIPPTPSGLIADVGTQGVTLRWDDAQAGTYDVWVGTTPGQPDVMTPAALLTTGQRTLALPGTVGPRAEVTLVLPPGTYYWGVQHVSAERVGSSFASGPAFSLTTTAAGGEEALPQAFALDVPAPSPFRTQTALRYHLPSAAEVTLGVYDVTGRRVRTLAAGLHPAGSHDASWNGTDDGGALLASGLYFCRLQAGTRTYTRTLLLVR